MREVVIESVPSWRRRVAMRFLVGGASSDSLARMQAEALFERTFALDADVAALWWARRGWHPLAAAMVYRNVGRTGTLLACPATAEGVDTAWLVRVVRELSLAEIRRGLSLVQTLLPAEAAPELAVLDQAGFHRLTRLTYMSLPVSGADMPCGAGVPPARPAGVPPSRFAGTLPARDGEDDLSSSSDQAHGTHNAGETPAPQATFHFAVDLPARELEDVIRRSYECSGDCPGLAGVREIDDVIAGHRASGLFSPESWWIVRLDGRSAGCLLLNESLAGGDGEVVYVGVVPEFRRQGLATAMLRQAISHARRVGWRRLALAADATNLPAIRLYESFQFAVSHHREAWIFTRNDARADLTPQKRC